MSQTTSQTCAYEYTVRRGDSFYLIAHRLGVPLKDLLEANSDINPARLMVGDVLCIPGAAAETPDTNITAPTTPDASDTTTNDALDTPRRRHERPRNPRRRNARHQLFAQRLTATRCCRAKRRRTYS